MVLGRAAALFALVIPWIAGCAVDEESPGRVWEPEMNAENGTCAPQTCTSAGKTCGTHDDGCGGQIDCGKCIDDQCAPKTCEELGKTCGRVDDECGGIVDCGECASCPADAKAGNGAPENAANLGEMTDSPTTTKRVEALSLGENEEDWFSFKVKDAGYLGNPLVQASVTGTSLEVSAFYLCDSQTNYSKCPVTGEKTDSTVGVGCTGKGTASVWSDCSGLTENGTAFVRVRRASGAQQCVSYALEINVKQKAW